jgi:hypothetical protein
MWNKTFQRQDLFWDKKEKKNSCLLTLYSHLTICSNFFSSWCHLFKPQSKLASLICNINILICSTYILMSYSYSMLESPVEFKNYRFPGSNLRTLPFASRIPMSVFLKHNLHDTGKNHCSNCTVWFDILWQHTVHISIYFVICNTEPICSKNLHTFCLKWWPEILFQQPLCNTVI